MLRHLMSCLVAVVLFGPAAQAGDHYYFPRSAFAPSPVAYAVPAVAYQPAYVVPSVYVGVQSYPVTTVAYSGYYAPMVPVAPVAPVYYAPRPMMAPVYAAPGYYAPYRHHRRFRGVEIEIERDGDIEIDYR